MEAEMAQQENRGSAKLLQELFGGKPPQTHAEAMTALGVSQDSVKLIRWWWKGQPVPDWFFASVQVKPDAVGDVASRLIRAGFVVDGFPLGMPTIDGAVLNISNIPHEMRG
jgi:hypothetical protein